MCQLDTKKKENMITNLFDCFPPSNSLVWTNERKREEEENWFFSYVNFNILSFFPSGMHLPPSQNSRYFFFLSLFLLSSFFVSHLSNELSFRLFPCNNLHLIYPLPKERKKIFHNSKKETMKKGRDGQTNSEKETKIRRDRQTISKKETVKTKERRTDR